MLYVDEYVGKDKIKLDYQFKFKIKLLIKAEKPCLFMTSSRFNFESKENKNQNFKENIGILYSTF